MTDSEGLFIDDGELIVRVSKDNHIWSYSSVDEPCLRLDKIPSEYLNELIRNASTPGKAFGECGIEEVFRQDSVKEVLYLYGRDAIIEFISHPEGGDIVQGAYDFVKGIFEKYPMVAERDFPGMFFSSLGQ